MTFAVLANAQEKRQITVAAASDMSFALKEIAELYTKKTGGDVRISFGSSGNLYHQIRNGLPVDVFLSADEEFPQRLVQEGIGEKDSCRRYATGALVIWVPSSSAIDVAKLGERALTNTRVKRIAIPNPQHAPYGRAARAALQRLGLWERLQKKLVLGENISQAAQFVQSGNADVGIIALSYALSVQMKDGMYWRVPGEWHPPIQQGLVRIVREGSDAAAVDAFFRYLFSDQAQAVLKRYGFELPAEPRR